MAKLSEEIAALKESKNALEKRLRNCSCLSVTAASSNHHHHHGVRGTKANEQTKVDQITATARAEIQKLVNHEILCLFPHLFSTRRLMRIEIKRKKSELIRT